MGHHVRHPGEQLRQGIFLGWFFMCSISCWGVVSDLNNGNFLNDYEVRPSRYAPMLGSSIF